MDLDRTSQPLASTTTIPSRSSRHVQKSPAHSGYLLFEPAHDRTVEGTVEVQVCTKCCVFKFEDDFYARWRAKAGRIAACKTCVKVAVRENRARNRDRYVAFDAKRYRENPNRRAHAAKCSERWKKTERGKAVVRMRKSVQRERYNAREQVAYALRVGRLIRQPCEVCDDVETHGHHDDYTKPLTVRWLCRKHHAEHHRAFGKSPRQEIAVLVPKEESDAVRGV